MVTRLFFCRRATVPVAGHGSLELSPPASDLRLDALRDLRRRGGRRDRDLGGAVPTPRHRGRQDLHPAPVELLQHARQRTRARRRRWQQHGEADRLPGRHLNGRTTARVALQRPVRLQHAPRVRQHLQVSPISAPGASCEPAAMTEKTVVLYPSLGVGHLNPMVQLAKAFLRRGVAVTIVVVDPPGKDPVLEAAVARLAAACPSMTVRLLPIPPACADEQYSHPALRMLDELRLASPLLREFLGSLPAVDALVLDMFCIDALDLAADLAVPAYIFYPSAAGDLAIYLQVPDCCRAAPSSFKDMGATVLPFSGVPPVRALDMPDTMIDRESDMCRRRVQQLARMPEARGILVNSFEALESRALKALRDGLCVPAGRSTPQIYCVGPLVDGGVSVNGESGDRHACLEWLDRQPEQSVVFLCFESGGVFSAAQLGEMARGLERSGQRFLWTVRIPREEQSKFGELDPELFLPDGFLQRNRDRGLVLKNWAPQAEVIQHKAVGAFVTHCGWNSALEAIMAGVPMICWPLYAEQRLNKVHLVEEMKIGVAVEGYEEGLVKAEEVETKVRLVMESEDGQKLRDRMAMAKEMAADAVRKGGSSDLAVYSFLKHLEMSKFEKGQIRRSDNQ